MEGANSIVDLSSIGIQSSAVGSIPLEEVCMSVKLQSAISLFTCGCLVSAAASPSNIGFVVTSGQAQIDGMTVYGNSTLFQGSVVQAGDVTTDLMFSGGSNLLLQPGSAVKVYREYAVLQHGVAIQRRTQGYTLVADGLKVSSLSPQSAIVVGLKDRSHVEVAAQGGPAEVRTAAGDLVARLEPGKALSFAIQVPAQEPSSIPSQQNSAPTPAGQTAPTTPPTQAAPSPVVQVTLHGILRKDHAGRYGHYLLTDSATNVVYELQGPDLEDLVGASVEVTGSTFDATPAEGASKVVSVSDIQQVPLGKGNATVAAGTVAPATPPAEPAPAGGTSSGSPTSTTPTTNQNKNTKILIIVGIAGAAAVGAAVGLAGGKSPTVSPE
jgi:hypothetical protein